MAKASKKKSPDKYKEKYAIKGSFEDVIKVSVTPKQPDPKEEKKKKPTKK